MSANIESFIRANGTKPAWHGLGGTIDANAGIDAWQVAAGMNWEVLSSPVIYKAGELAHVDKTRQVFFRSDRHDQVIGIMSDQYKPVQPREALEFFDQLQHELNIQLDTAGVLQGGARYWALAKNNESVAINGTDKIDDYLLVATSNDGTMATRIGPCRIRVVCQNTLTAAISQSTGMLSINHRTRIDWNKAKQWVTGEKQDFELFGNLMQGLASIPVSNEQAAQFESKLLGWDGKGEVPRKLQALHLTMNKGIGQAEAGKTAYGLLNGVSRWTDHERQTRGEHGNESRLNSAWFGASALLKQQAMDLLVSQCVNQWGHASQLQPVLVGTKYAA